MRGKKEEMFYTFYSVAFGHWRRIRNREIFYADGLLLLLLLSLLFFTKIPVSKLAINKEGCGLEGRTGSLVNTERRFRGVYCHN
jgi:hypothetical protein